MKAVKTQSWNSSEYQNLKLSLQRDINPKPHLNTASVFIISVTDAIVPQPNTLGFLLQGSYLFTFALTIHTFTFHLKLFQCVYLLLILMLLIHVLYALLAGIRKWENNLQNNIYAAIFLGLHGIM